MTGCLSCSQANDVEASVVTTVNVHFRVVAPSGREPYKGLHIVISLIFTIENDRVIKASKDHKSAILTTDEVGKLLLPFLQPLKITILI